MPLIAISDQVFEKLGNYYGENEDIETALWRLIKEYDKDDDDSGFNPGREE